MSPGRRLSRRGLLVGGLATWGSTGLATSRNTSAHGFHTVELAPTSPEGVSWRTNVYVPDSINGPLAPVILLHGLGETRSAELGVRAWADLYGALAAAERLRSGHIKPLLPKAGYLTQSRCLELNAQLRADPYQDVLLVCPATPNPHQPGPAAKTLTRFSAWLEQGLLPALWENFGNRVGPRAVGLAGCSMGGYVALEVFTAKPHLFSAISVTQCAIGAWRAPGYADSLEHATSQHARLRGGVHLQSSTQDPYLEATRALSRELTRRDVTHALRVSPGPHNQPWLQEIGSAETLLFLAQRLRPTTGR